MQNMDRRLSPRILLSLLLLAALVFVALGPLVRPVEAEPVRKQIKTAKRDLIEFERDITHLVETFDGLSGELGSLSKTIRSTKAALQKMRDPKNLYEQALASLVLRPVLEQSLDQATTRRDIISALLPKLRNHIWNQGLERKEKIETLDAAIELLQSARRGDLVTKSGVGAGQLITYSADWAAVSLCESSGRWHIDAYFDGGLQFLPSTWWGFGGGAYGHYAYQATRRQQIDIAERVLAVQGPNAWPNCFAALPADTDE